MNFAYADRITSFIAMDVLEAEGHDIMHHNDMKKEVSTMTSSMASLNPGGEVRALDPDLPFLASEAAVDLANLISGDSDDMEAIRQLANTLKNSIKKGPSGTPSRSHMDPAALTIVGGAVAEFSSNDPSSRKVDDLLTRAMGIAEFLSSEDMRQEPDKLKEAMDFCVALSRAAIAYRHSIRDLRPSHPVRR